MLLVVVVICGLLPGIAFAVEPSQMQGRVGPDDVTTDYAPWWWQNDDIGAGVVEVGAGNIGGRSSTASPWADYADNITKIIFTEPVTGVRDLRGLFFELSNLVEIEGIYNIDTTGINRVGGMNNMFRGTSSLISLDLGAWDMSNVRYMIGMFRESGITELTGTANWDTSSVTTMDSIFRDTINLTSLDVSAWDTSNLQDIRNIFRESGVTELIGIENWNTSEVATMEGVFRGTSNLTSLDVSAWDTSSVTTMESTFRSTVLMDLELENWDTSSVTNMSNMFRDSSVITLDLSGWDTGNLGNVNEMFTNAELQFLIVGADSLIQTVAPPNIALVIADTPRPSDNETDEPVQGLEILERQAYLFGADDGLIRPNDDITREEVATIFFQQITDDMRATYWLQENPFPDVVPENRFNNAVSTTTNVELFNGFPDGTFAPDRLITRAEMTAVIVRFMGQAYGMDFAEDYFNDIYGHWAAGYINTAATNGWVQGHYGLGYAFYPDSALTRAEAAAMVNRVFGRLSENFDDLLPEMQTWTDNSNEDAWFYFYVQSATNSYSFTLRESGDNVYESWVNIIPARNWEVLERPDSVPEDIFREF